MSLMVMPEWLTTAAADAAEVGSVVGAANAAAVDPITGLLAAAEDEVSAAIADLFSAHGQGYQALSAQAALFHDRFVQALANAGEAYAVAEAASASPLASTVAQLGQWEQALNDGVAIVQLEIQQTSTALATGFTRVSTTLLTTIFGAPAAPPFAATQDGTYTGTPSLVTRLEEAALYPVKPFLALSGLDTLIASPGNPLLALIASDVPPLSWFIGNSPPPLLNLLLGETVQYTTYDGMSVVQITPAQPTGEYVVAIHGGAFIFPPSFLHWIHYSVMAQQTGATIQVPIYPLLQQGGTAGVVVPQMAGLISSQIAQHGASNVSVIGDSAGGNLALAAVQYMVATPSLGPVPSSMVLLSPWLDLGMTNPNIAFVQDPLLPFGPAQQFGRAWAGNLSVTNPLVSPLYGSMSGLPPTYVYSGNLDILSPDVLVLQKAAVAAGAPISLVLANGQIHDWLILTLDGFQYWPQINQELGIAA